MPTVRARPMPKGKKNPEEWKQKPIIMQMRGTPDFKGWLERLAEFDRTTVADIADRAIVRYAREIGFKEDPPKR